MEIPGAGELATLLELRDRTVASIYMPTHRIAPDNRQDPIRFRNLVRQAEEGLVARGVRRPVARRIAAPAGGLIDQPDFWIHAGDGLAVFLAENVFHAYRLPVLVPELVIVSGHPHVKPLLPSLHENRQFYVLAVSQHHVRLLACTRFECRRVGLAGVPQSAQELAPFIEADRAIQFHTRTAPMPGKRAAMFHGQGAAGDEARKKRELHDFIWLVSRGVQRALAVERAPLVLAGTKYIRSAFAAAIGYAGTQGDGIEGNPEVLSDEQIRELAWPIVEPIFRGALDRIRSAFEQAKLAGRGSNRIEEVVPAAVDGRIETLLVALDALSWGHYDSFARQAVVHENHHAGDDELLDLAAIHTLLNRGQAIACPRSHVPGGSVAAVFRY